MSTKTCSNNMVSPNDHVVMNHQNQTPNKWHMRPCSLHSQCQFSFLWPIQWLVEANMAVQGVGDVLGRGPVDLVAPVLS
jgi:hypothetical protein